MYCRQIFYYAAVIVALTRSIHAQDQVDTPLTVDNCVSHLLPGDTENGISAFSDATCLSGDDKTGCFHETCRFCQKYQTDQSLFYKLCAPTENAQFEISSADCASSVSSGDQGVGISAYYDSACSGGGLGCLPNNCRFCKTRTTPQSQAYLDCSTSSAPGPTPAPTVAPSTASTITNCGDAVATSGLTFISYIVENRCNSVRPRLIGCVPLSTCQLCRTSKNEGNQYLDSCQVLQAQQSVSVSNDLDPIQIGHNDALTSIVVGVGALVAVAVAIVAIRKVRRQRPNIEYLGTPRECSQFSSIINIGGKDARFGQLL